MHELKQIVVGVDFSRPSRRALAVAFRLARETGATLHATHVIDRYVERDLRRSMPAHTNVEGVLLEHANEKLANWVDEARAIAPDEAPTIEFKAVLGNDYNQLANSCDEVNADLLVIGSNGYSDSRWGAGMVATRSLRKVHRDVLVVREAPASPFSCVVACIDFSATSRHVVEEAVRIATLDDARLHILHSYSPAWRALHYMQPVSQVLPDYREQYMRGLEGMRGKFLAPFESELERLEAEVHVVEGRSHNTTIVEFLIDVGADIVVLGRHGKSRVRAALLGTTAERVMRRAPCSAWVVEPSRRFEASAELADHHSEAG